MMSDMIRQETAVFLILSLHGARMALIYDLIRALRRSIPHGIALVSAEDFLYWTASAFLTFCLIFSGAEGKIRGYMAVGMALGALLYHLTLGQLVVMSASRLFRLSFRFFGRIVYFGKCTVIRICAAVVGSSVLRRPLHFIGRILRRSAKKARKKGRKSKKRIEFTRKKGYNKMYRSKEGRGEAVRRTQYGRKQKTFKQ